MFRRHNIWAILAGFLLSFSALATIKPLKANEAFAFSAMAKDSQTIVAHWKIAKNHYLYRNRIHFSLAKGEKGTLSDPILPSGKAKEDEDLGKYQIYADELNIAVPIMPAKNQRSVKLLATYQGCSASGYCYPPMTKQVTLQLNGNFGQATKGMTVATPHQTQAALLAKHDVISDLLASQHYLTILLSFLGFGLLLSFTPCVLPMIPILSSIIVGHKAPMHMSKAFCLSLIYVLSMSMTYAIAGILVGYMGSSVQALFQTPWVLGFSSLIFIALALSFFGFYDLQLPQKWQNRLTLMSNRQQGGTYLGVVIMGCLATLIVSPCVTPALVGALGYIGKTGDAMLGGLALFTLGFGMGIPLLVIGTAGGKLIPKAGPWMDAVKNVFGVILLGMAIWLIDRIIPGQITLMLWAALFIISAMFLGAFSPHEENNWRKFRKGCGMIMLVYGSMMVVGAAMGNDNPLQPLLHVNHQSTPLSNKLHFAHVKSIGDVDKSIERYQDTNKMVMLDFYADWCVSCRDMQRNTFNDPMVKQLLSHFTLLKADLTHNDSTDHLMQRHFDVIAPPVLIFFKPDGEELSRFRLVGEVGTHELVAHLQKILNDSQTG